MLGALLTTGNGVKPAMRADVAVVVGKRGTTAVTSAELRLRILPAVTLAPEENTVFHWSVLDDRLAEWRRQHLRIGLTSGCFDLDPSGQVKMLAEAPFELIGHVQPTVLVKGGDYKHDGVVGADHDRRGGGEVVLVGLVPGHRY